jgi:hypothetical protein
MLFHGYQDPALGRCLKTMKEGEVIFYGKDGRVVSSDAAADKFPEITHVCLRNSEDGKTSVFAVTDPEHLKNAMRARSGGSKVTFAFIRGDSPEVANSEVAPRENTRQKFLQTLTGSFFTTGIGALVTVLSIFVSAFITGNPISIPAIFVSAITFVIFTVFGLLAYTLA